jgi:hypothetical protein
VTVPATSGRPVQPAMAEPPSSKVTLPVGVPAPLVTVAVSATGWP